jgi:tetratricopeptide (TPR) repeat protein
MKRIAIILVLITMVIPVFSQTQTFEGLKRNLERSDAAIEHPKRQLNPKTWYDRGVLFQEIYEVNTQFLRLGLPVQDLTLFMRSPLSIETVESKDGARELYKYPRVNVYVQDGAVVDWEETEMIHPDPLNEALTSFTKAIELDSRERYASQIKESLTRLNNQMLNKAILAYQEEDYEESYKFFTRSLKVNEKPIMSDLPMDTALYFNTGLVASFAKKHEEAIKYYQKAAEYDFGGGNLYVLLKDQYVALEDSASAEKALQEGFKKYPDDNAIVIELINYYITSGKSKDALAYLAIAKDLEPSNASLYFAEGFLYERMEDFEKALNSYLKAVDTNPEYFDALYNAGALYYNQAVKEFEKANEIMDNKAYGIARDSAMKTLAKAVPYMERAHEVNPTEKTTLETLKTLYYRLQMTDKLEEIEEKLSKLE